MATLLGDARAYGQAYNVMGEDVVSQAGFVELIAEVIGRPVTLRHFDAALLKSFDTPGPVFGQNLVYDCHAVHTTTKLRDELGLRPRYSLHAASPRPGSGTAPRGRPIGPSTSRSKTGSSPRSARDPRACSCTTPTRRRPAPTPISSVYRRAPSTSTWPPPRRRPPGRAPTPEIFYGWNPPRPLLAGAKGLRWIQCMGAGVERLLVPELPDGVRVTRAAGIFGPWMAEYTLGWCLWVTQRMDGFRASQRQRRWAPVDPVPLRGQTLCVVGLGDIGRTIAKTARALGMQVIGVTPERPRGA